MKDQINNIIYGILVIVGALTLLAASSRKLFASLRTSVQEFKKLANEFRSKPAKDAAGKRTVVAEQERGTVTEKRRGRTFLDKFLFVFVVALLGLGLCWDITETAPLTRVMILLISVKVSFLAAILMMEFILNLLSEFKEILRDIVQVLAHATKIGTGTIEILEKHDQVISTLKKNQTQGNDGESAPS